MVQPVILSPVYKDYLWGGSKLKTHYGKNSSEPIVAESWELSTHADGISSIAGGPFQGCNLKEYIQKIGAGCTGLKAGPTGELPILIKFIDAREALSIQVHPDDQYARCHENSRGKTEMWVILDHDPGAFLYFGVDQEVSKDAFLKAVEQNTVTSLLKKAPVQKGDVFFIPPGTIHAIGKGIVICEIQQSSNITYRLYDFDRKDAQGNKRPLHLEKALAVANLTPIPVYTQPELSLFSSSHTQIDRLRSCGYFNTYRYQVEKSVAIRGSIQSFTALIVLEGALTLQYQDQETTAEKGETVFIPANNEPYTLSGPANFY